MRNLSVVRDAIDPELPTVGPSLVFPSHNRLFPGVFIHDLNIRTNQLLDFAAVFHFIQNVVYRIQKVPFKAKCDVAFACAGGYPKDVSLYQGCKCYDPSDVVTKEGGLIIAIMEASDIYEPPAYMGSFKYDTEEDLADELKLPDPYVAVRLNRLS